MPRVSEAHLEARRRQILEAARTCFVRSGFHATSMQDVIAAADLSVGAVYRYFPSKHALVQAIAEEAIGRIAVSTERLMALEPPLPLLELIDEILRFVDQETAPDRGVMRMAVQVWGEALVDDQLAGTVASVYGHLRNRYTAVAARAQARGELEATADAPQVASILFGLTLGYGLQRMLLGDVDRGAYLAGFRQLLSLRESGPER
ncbi:MAG: TetR/AcrR family transcriptional regulator [Dactylosporangium sp.]|nr:TetR/AcrR family transcriptional regulator [Dactylosporangium sp.]NNJ62992.1 TetR/AcrR family transcriptional regulator [Dactylosporangium sp.]